MQSAEMPPELEVFAMYSGAYGLKTAKGSEMINSLTFTHFKEDLLFMAVIDTWRGGVKFRPAGGVIFWPMNT